MFMLISLFSPAIIGGPPGTLPPEWSEGAFIPLPSAEPDGADHLSGGPEMQFPCMRAATTLLATLLVGVACRSGKPEGATSGGSAPAGEELTAFQLENGIGPITAAVTLPPIDKSMASEGKELFNTKCAACHKMSERYVGPALGEVTTRRTPAFIMNQILNPEGMYTKHPVVKQLLGEYMTQMPNLGLTQEQARQIVEYLRTQAPGTAGS